MNKTHLRCINLNRRPDRWRLFGQGLNSTTLKTLPLKRFDAIDGKRLKEEIRGRGLGNEKIIGLLRDESYQAGVLGCLLSHYFLWKEITSDDAIGDDDAVIVLEDDARFSLYSYDEVLREIHGIPKQDWIIMYIGGRWWPSFVPESDPDDFRHLSGHVFRRHIRDKSKIGHSVSLDRCATAYATHRRGAALMAAATEEYLASQPFHAIDYLLVDVFSESGSLDYFPHVVYSPLWHDVSDAQAPGRISIAHDENAADGPAAPAGGTTVSSS